MSWLQRLLFKFNPLFIVVAPNSRKQQKLSKKEYDALLAEFRRLTPHIRDRVAKLIHHIEWATASINKLEEELRALKQKSFFEEAKAITENHIQNSIIPEWKKEVKEYTPLNIRLKLMLDQNQYGSDNWKRHLKYNNISDETALALAKGDLDYEEFCRRQNRKPGNLEKPLHQSSSSTT